MINLEAVDYIEFIEFYNSNETTIYSDNDEPEE